VYKEKAKTPKRNWKGKGKLVKRKALYDEARDVGR